MSSDGSIDVDIESGDTEFQKVRAERIAAEKAADEAARDAAQARREADAAVRRLDIATRENIQVKGAAWQAELQRAEEARRAADTFNRGKL